MGLQRYCLSNLDLNQSGNALMARERTILGQINVKPYTLATRTYKLVCCSNEIIVNNIYPALETIFQLLENRASTRKVTLNFKLCIEYPGQGTMPHDINHQPSTINHQPSTINHQPSTINHQPSTINHQPSTINHQPSTINHQPSTINHQPSTINHQTCNPALIWTDSSHRPSRRVHSHLTVAPLK